MNIRKWIGFLGQLVFVLVLTSFTKSISFKEKTVSTINVERAENILVNFPDVASKYNTLTSYDFIFLKRDYQGFKEALAFKESQGSYTAINTLGYIGKYQFGAGTLKLLGINDSESFVYKPSIQEKAFELNVSRNKWILRRYIKTFVGKRINGTVVSESGMIAAAHLAGPGNVKKYLNTYGKTDFKDAYGTNMAYYLKRFNNYDISSVKSQHNPKI